MTGGVSAKDAGVGRSAWVRAFMLLSCAFALFFGSAFALLSVAPERVERAVRPYVIELLKAEALERYPSLKSLSAFSGLAERLRATGRATRELATSEYPEALARAFSRFCKYECGDEPTLASTVRESLARALDSIGGVLGRVEAWASGRYGAMVLEVVRDVRIVTGTNALLFALAAAALHSGRATRLTLSIAGILCATSLLASYLYFFAQDWLMTVLFASYVGTAYWAWVGLIGAALADCVFNRARVVAALLEAVSSLLNA